MVFESRLIIITYKLLDALDGTPGYAIERQLGSLWFNGVGRTEMRTVSTWGISSIIQGISGVCQVKMSLMDYLAYSCNVRVLKADSESIYLRRQGRRGF